MPASLGSRHHERSERDAERVHRSRSCGRFAHRRATPNLQPFAHRDVFVEGLLKAGGPE
jgi:hypothetical protein